MENSQNNIAYIDGQNLYMGTTKREPVWIVDLQKFRVYLKEKYKVKKAYYYLGYVQDGANFETLYEEIQSAGFILVFREHSSAMKGTKKGNVDADIVFSIMKRLYKKEPFDKVILVSGDGDYKMLVDFLIEENKFEKILFPKRRFASSLYKAIGATYYADLSEPSIRIKIGKKEKGSLGN
ncbi:NYN domain-containing protein [Candidatus Nomurabacteria bacterium]|nr:NYN domain-containing protein [Candidatus Kaiserbacteria bacterium]MCB9814257.1 NYN domain-containing protein [Candidatus Nomurabacteria bacterium]